MVETIDGTGPQIQIFGYPEFDPTDIDVDNRITKKITDEINIFDDIIDVKEDEGMYTIDKIS